jgi:uncharacterized protein YeaO (DUF488 family)
MIKTKSVYSAIDRHADGLRILVTRFRGRGLPKNRYSIWMPCLGPTEHLLKRFQAGKLTWAKFANRYRAELFEGGSIDRRNRTIKNHGQKFTLRLLQALGKRGHITVMCHCAEDQVHCHRHILHAVLRRDQL